MMSNSSPMPPAAVVAYVARYTPRKLPADLWALAATEVRNTVLAMEPAGTSSANAYLSRITDFLAGPCGWDRTAAPDLRALLTAATIEQAASRQRPGSRHPYRSHLLSVGRMLGSVPASARRQRSYQPRPDRFVLAGVEQPLGVTVVVQAWSRKAGRPSTADVLRPVVEAHGRQSSPNAKPHNTSTVLSPASARALVEVTNQPVKDVMASRSNPAPVVSAPRPTVPFENGQGPRRSRRAAIAYAKAAKAAQMATPAAPAVEIAPPGPVPADIRTAVEAFLPQHKVRPTWMANLELGQRLVYGYAAPNPRNATLVASMVAAFLTWFATHPTRPVPGPPIDAAELLTPGLIDAYLRESNAPDRSAATYRSALRRVLRSLNGSPRPVTLTYKTVAPPYSPAECDWYAFLASQQPTDRTTANMSFLVGLGLGAGLDATDVRHLTRASFHDLSLDGELILMVTVSKGTRPRTVPVRTQYAPMVREALATHERLGKAVDDLIVGRVPDRTSVTTAVTWRAKTADGNRVQLRLASLRNAWLVAAMTAKIPLSDLLRVAGLTTARTLTDLLPYCPDADPTDIAEVLAHLSTVPTGSRDKAKS